MCAYVGDVGHPRLEHQTDGPSVSAQRLRACRLDVVVCADTQSVSAAHRTSSVDIRIAHHSAHPGLQIISDFAIALHCNATSVESHVMAIYKLHKYSDLPVHL